MHSPTAEMRSKVRMLNAISKVKLFERLPKDQMPLLAANFKEKKFHAGQDVITQGEQGNDFYVIQKGTVGVYMSYDNQPAAKVATLGPGDFFGENALIRNVVRNATIRAEMALTTDVITREKFRELELHKKLIWPKRNAVCGADTSRLKPSALAGKNIDRSIVKAGIASNSNLQDIFMKCEEDWDDLAQHCVVENIKAGEVVITQGALEENKFYIVASGEFEVVIDGVKICTMDRGRSFGELALLFSSPRAATVRALVDSSVYALERADFKSIMINSGNEEVHSYERYLDSIEAFADIPPEIKNQIAHALILSRFSKGDKILEQGKTGTTFHILVEGEVDIQKDSKHVASLPKKQGDFSHFGEIALQKECPVTASVIVRSEAATCMTIDYTSFRLLTGDSLDCERIRTKTIIRFNELNKIGLLGCGGFGYVELVEHSKTSRVFALKALSKGFLVKTKCTASVMREKEILMMCSSDFIVKAFETYRKSQRLYFLLEPVLGGELYETYNRLEMHGNVKHAQFYAACVVHAFEHMHVKKICYRDLKPENVLISDDGYGKVTDMGLAKVVPGKTYTSCGTPEYFAPEVINPENGHSLPVDWWTLGILIFEILSGESPFSDQTPMHIMKNINAGMSEVKMPPLCNGEAKPLLYGLLNKDPSERLPMRLGWTENIKKSSWYSSFDWEGHYARRIKAPYVPVLKSKTDIQNFSALEEDKPTELPYSRSMVKDPHWDDDFATVADDEEVSSINSWFRSHMLDCCCR